MPAAARTGDPTDHGGTVISPLTSSDSSPLIASSSTGNSAGATPCFDSSWLNFTSTSTGSFFPSTPAAEFSLCAIFSESTASMA